MPVPFFPGGHQGTAPQAHHGAHPQRGAPRAGDSEPAGPPMWPNGGTGPDTRAEAQGGRSSGRPSGPNSGRAHLFLRSGRRRPPPHHRRATPPGPPTQEHRAPSPGRRPGGACHRRKAGGRGRLVSVCGVVILPPRPGAAHPCAARGKDGRGRVIAPGRPHPSGPRAPPAGKQGP